MLTHESAKAAIERARALDSALRTNLHRTAEEFAAHFRFVAIVGPPRTGGSYLTAELYSSLGVNPQSVPAVIAHDGFPEARPFTSLTERGTGFGGNEWTKTISSTAEYIVMLEILFGPASGAPHVVPKKLTKAVYAGGFFRCVLGAKAEYIVTVRHPVASCVSTYEKSGGLPEKTPTFRVRSAIERWIARDVALLAPRWRLTQRDYFEVYVRYWEQYYRLLASSCLTSGRKRTVLAYSEQSMTAMASRFRRRYAGRTTPAQFLIKPGYAAGLRPEWLKRGEEAMRRVKDAWAAADLDFPLEALQECL